MLLISSNKQCGKPNNKPSPALSRMAGKTNSQMVYYWVYHICHFEVSLNFGQPHLLYPPSMPWTHASRTCHPGSTQLSLKVIPMPRMASISPQCRGPRIDRTCLITNQDTNFTRYNGSIFHKIPMSLVISPGIHISQDTNGYHAFTRRHGAVFCLVTIQWWDWFLSQPKLTQFGHQGIIPLGSAEVSRFAVSVLQFPLTTWIAAALSA